MHTVARRGPLPQRVVVTHAEAETPDATVAFVNAEFAARFPRADGR